jgi:hypothetical protein
VNATVVATNGIETTIRNNTFVNAEITFNRNGTTGNFIGCHFENCLLNFASSVNIEKLSIVLSPELRETSISVDNINLSNKIVTPFESNIEKQIDITGDTILDLDGDVGNFAILVGTIVTETSSNFETIDSMKCSNFVKGRTIVVRPKVGKALDITTTATTSATATCFVSEKTVGTYRLEGDNGDFVEITNIKTNGVECWFVKFNITQ